MKINISAIIILAIVFSPIFIGMKDVDSVLGIPPVLFWGVLASITLLILLFLKIFTERSKS